MEMQWWQRELLDVQSSNQITTIDNIDMTLQAGHSTRHPSNSVEC